MERDLQEIMPQDCPGDFNQALMELGAVICVPNGQAICEKCPAAFACMAYRHGTVDELPVKAPKKARKKQNPKSPKRKRAKKCRGPSNR